MALFVYHSEYGEISQYTFPAKFQKNVTVQNLNSYKTFRIAGTVYEKYTSSSSGFSAGVMEIG
jgi:hypothetical protein